MINYLYAAAGLRGKIAREWDEQIARHMHITDGFSIVAMAVDQPVGVLAVVCRPLPSPLQHCREGFIDIIQVAEGNQRQGIARRLLLMAEQRVRAEGCHQLRAWSAEDKMAAIAMWRRLGFGLCSAHCSRRRKGDTWLLRHKIRLGEKRPARDEPAVSSTIEVFRAASATTSWRLRRP